MRILTKKCALKSGLPPLKGEFAARGGPARPRLLRYCNYNKASNQYLNFETFWAEGRLLIQSVVFPAIFLPFKVIFSS